MWETQKNQSSDIFLNNIEKNKYVHYMPHGIYLKVGEALTELQRHILMSSNTEIGLMSALKFLIKG